MIKLPYKKFKAFMKRFNKDPIPVTRLRNEMLKNIEKMLESGKIYFPHSPRQHGRFSTWPLLTNLVRKERL